MNTTPNPIRILLADDHPVLRRGIQALAADERDMQFVAEASNGQEAIEQFRKHRPDIVLMDLQMPEMNGVDAMIAIRKEFPDACFLCRRGGAHSILAESSRRPIEWMAASDPRKAHICD